jgi:hypothetical protein
MMKRNCSSATFCGVVPHLQIYLKSCIPFTMAMEDPRFLYIFLGLSEL